MTAPLPPIKHNVWPSAHRIINSKYPPVSLFEDIADPADWELLASAESQTNPRLFEGIGNLALVPNERRAAGPGASWVMAPFVHASPYRPGRFHSDDEGAYYAGDSFEVALFEAVYHFENFLRATDEPPCSATFRELVGKIEADLHDLSGPGFAECLDPDSYTASQRVATELREQESSGVIDPSVRYPGGLCVAQFYPKVPRIPSQAGHYLYHWDGNWVTYVTNLSQGGVFAIVPQLPNPV